MVLTQSEAIGPGRALPHEWDVEGRNSYAIEQGPIGTLPARGA